jgi:glycosyltransferase involved in cell wall biosynthesis
MSDLRIQATVEILTFNSAATVRAALESVKDFDDIIVIDGGSTDKTLDIAREYGARIIKQDSTFLKPDGSINDFSGIRNQGLSTAKYDWFFFLDSDEEASPQLLERLRSLAASSTPAAYWVARRYTFKGTVIKCSASYPNQQMRFFHRAGVQGFRKKIHERVVPSQETSIEHIAEPILVPSESAGTLKRKMRYYLAIEVERLTVAGRGSLLRAALGGGKGTLSFIFRLFRTTLFCRGSRLPLSYELRPLQYQLRLMFSCLIHFFRL